MNEIENLLSTLAEECAEVVIECSKANRFGLGGCYPADGPSNAEKILTEFYEGLAVIEMLQEEGALNVLSDEDISEIKEKKKSRVKKWMKYSEEKGRLG